jgi:hypothetical protein
MSDMRTSLDLVEGALVVRNVQQCTPIAEHAQRLHNEGFHGSSDMKHAAEIPSVFVEDYCQRNGITFEEFIRNKEHVKRLCNDPAVSHFRIWKGRL